MPKRISDEQREAMLRLLARGEDRDTIAAAVGVTPGQVSAVAAHVKMGTYSLPLAEEEETEKEKREGQRTCSTSSRIWNQALDAILGSGGGGESSVESTPDPVVSPAVSSLRCQFILRLRAREIGTDTDWPRLSK